MRAALLAVTALIPITAAHAQMQSSLDATAQMIMSDQQSQVPGGECAATSPCQSQGLIPITFQPGDVVLTGSVTDAAGDVWSLQPDSCNGNAPSGWWSGLYLNGVQQWCGYGVALRDVNGDVWYEEAKGSGWKDLSSEEASGTLTGAMYGPYVTDPGEGTGNSTQTATPVANPGQGTGEAAAAASPTLSASPVQTCPGLTLGLANGAVIPGSGSFQANGNTYSIDATNTDVASINGQPINQWAYQTSQLVQGSDGVIYGQSNAPNNDGQWFALSSDGSSWQPLTGVPAALIPTGPGGNTLSSTSSSTDTTAMNEVAAQVCPQLTSIQGQINSVNQQASQIAQGIEAQTATTTTTTPAAATPAPADSTTGNGGLQ